MLPRKYKLKRDNDFKKVFKQGRYCRGNFIRIKFLRNSLEFSRFAFIVGLKISKKAVQRNKTRRQLEKATQLVFNQISAKGETSPLQGGKTSFDLVIMVQPEIIRKEYQEIEEELINLFKKIKPIN